MRRSLTAASLFLAAAAVGTMALAPAAEAQSRKRPLIVKVKPRSYFDAGNVVPVGSLNRYAADQTFRSAPVYSYIGSRFGETTLPDRIGAGASPFPRF